MRAYPIVLIKSTVYVQCKMYIVPYYGIYVTLAHLQKSYIYFLYILQIQRKLVAKLPGRKKYGKYVLYCCYRNHFFSFVQLFYTCCNNIFVFDLQGDSLVTLDCQLYIYIMLLFFKTWVAGGSLKVTLFVSIYIVSFAQ